MRKFSIIERWGVMSLLIVGCIYLYLNHFRDEIIADHTALIKKNNDIVKLIDETIPADNIESIEQRVAKLRSDVNALKKQLQEVKTLRLTEKSREEEMMLRINEMAANNGLMVEQMIPCTKDEKDLFASVQTEQKTLGRILYSMSLSGRFKSFYEFFAEIRNLPSVVNITHVSIKREKESENVNVDLLFII